MGQGRGWQPGQVRARLAALIEQYRDVPKQPATAYVGGDIGSPLHLICCMRFPQSESMHPCSSLTWTPSGHGVHPAYRNNQRTCGSHCVAFVECTGIPLCCRATGRKGRAMRQGEPAVPPPAVCFNLGLCLFLIMLQGRWRQRCWPPGSAARRWCRRPTGARRRPPATPTRRACGWPRASPGARSALNLNLCAPRACAPAPYARPTCDGAEHARAGLGCSQDRHAGREPREQCLLSKFAVNGVCRAAALRRLARTTARARCAP